MDQDSLVLLVQFMMPTLSIVTKLTVLSLKPDLAVTLKTVLELRKTKQTNIIAKVVMIQTPSLVL